jgi:hypothetical protein
VNNIKKAASILLGALLLGFVVYAWSFTTGSIVSYVERGWCWSAGYPADCHFRGVWTFLVWCIIGITGILVVGFLIERISGVRHRDR